MDKFYNVEVTFNFVMRAKEGDEPYWEAEDLAGEAFRDMSLSEADIYCHEIKSLDELPSGWDGDCYPYTNINGVEVKLGEALGEGVRYE